MIPTLDPTNITAYDLDHKRLEFHLVFWCLVAGKTAAVVAPATTRLMERLHQRTGLTAFDPFYAIRTEQRLADQIKAVGVGCYNGRARTLKALAKSNVNLAECSAEYLESFAGIGPKTARCFLLHTRRDVRYSGLDTHVRKWLRRHGHAVPDGQLSRKKYLELEAAVLAMADAAGMTPAAYDLFVWNRYARKVRASDGG